MTELWVNVTVYKNMAQHFCLIVILITIKFSTEQAKALVFQPKSTISPWVTEFSKN
jgi:hypothetical protein